MKFRFHSRYPARAMALLGFGTLLLHRCAAAESPGAAEFRTDIRPILQTYCFDCHADGVNKGKVAFDEFKSGDAALQDRDLWFKALKNLRANLMPPAKKPRPTSAQRELIAHWIKNDVFGIDPQNPDPGRVTIRRLNRVEYRNTIRDLVGVDFDTDSEFPPDDTSFGFDTIGDVLTLPPMLLEKYLIAAEKIIDQAVPKVPLVVPERKVPGGHFHAGSGSGDGGDDSLSLSYYRAAAVSNRLSGEIAGKYLLIVDLVAREKFVDDVFDYNKCQFIFKVDGNEIMSNNYSWQGGTPYHYEINQNWAAGDHELAFELQPLTPDKPQVRSLSMQIKSVTVRGPMEQKYWTRPKNYERFFPKAVPSGSSERREYAHQLLGNFARTAFRRPVDDATVDRLTDLAESIYSQPGKTFEAGVAQGMVAVLASPRFLFREEYAEPSDGSAAYPQVDEYSLASRLSYLLWSSMPDDELERLAAEGELRGNLSAQVARMLKDWRSQAFIHNFTGQWLRTRDVQDVEIDARSVLAREAKFDPEMDKIRKRFHELNHKPEDSLTKEDKEELATIRSQFFKKFKRPLRASLGGDLRYAMRMETEDTFDYVLRQDRSLLELLDSDYTFLNERLATHYGITNVFGDDMRRVTLPPDSVRGGILTDGTVLVVTSNPTRTSPVKRGLFILDNILGIPPAPPPPNLPPLEDATKDVTNHIPTLRETLAAHRRNPLCSSCHNRMDPLGLAFENFNAMGMFRKTEFNEPIDATGQLITGESFSNVKELKAILVKDHYEDFYRTVTEKLLTYALGRGLEYYDVETVDQIVKRIEKANGRASALLAGVTESAPFQKCRKQSTVTASLSSTSETAASNTQKP